jgi:hypothetical protein
MRYLNLLLVLALTFAFGCGSMVQEGRKIDAAKVKQLSPGQTSVADLEASLGKPDKVEKLSSGEENYIYRYWRENKYWIRIDKHYLQKLEVQVKDGVVRSYKFTEEGKDFENEEKL